MTRVRRLLSHRVTRRLGGYFLAWLVFAVPTVFAIFLNSSTIVAVASHDTEVTPTMDGWLTVETGPFLPDMRMPAEGTFGVNLVLGKTEAASTEAMVERYAFIASQPDAQVDRVRTAVVDLAWDAALRGGLLAVIPLLGWALLGRRRRHELLGATQRRRILTGGAILAVAAGSVTLLTLRPWQADQAIQADDAGWQSLAEFLPDLTIPEEAADVQVQVSATTVGTKRLLLSALDTYERSRNFYEAAEESARSLQVRQPEEGETVAVIVSDRHDNIGMDKVIRAVADLGGASAILDAGDDTSTGSAWEAFSLDSLQREFGDLDRFAVQGNHDHGGFVKDYLADRGWQTSSADIFEGPGGTRMMARDDPRSSGLGTWRNAVELTIGEVAESIAEQACAQEEPVNLLLVHDDDMGKLALERGCVDLVISGHVHVKSGPDAVRGDNGRVGYAFTNGTSGGAAYAIAVGSKLRRPAQFTLLTIRDGRPVGLQGVTLETNGRFQVDEYDELTYLPTGSV